MPWPSDYQEQLLPVRFSEAIEAEWTFAASTEGTHIVLPDGRMDLIVAFRDDGGSGLDDVTLLIVGPARRRAEVAVSAGDRFLGVRFRPGWGGPCLGIPPASLIDNALIGEAAEAALGADGGAIGAYRTPPALAIALSTFAHRRAALAPRPNATVRRAIIVIQASGGRLRLDEVARAVGVPERTLRRQLTLALGLSFKAFSAVVRFQRAMRLLNDASGPLAPAHAAIESGYSDQAHTTREFRRHGALLPAAGRRWYWSACRSNDVADFFKQGEVKHPTLHAITTEITMRLGYTIIYVPDVMATVEFYERAFGLQRRFVHESGLYAEMATGETTLSFAGESMAELNGVAIRPNSRSELSAGFEICLVTEAPEQGYSQAVEAGALALKAVETKNPGASASGTCEISTGAWLKSAHPWRGKTDINRIMLREDGSLPEPAPVSAARTPVRSAAAG